MNDLVKEELERLAETISVSAFQNLYINYDETKKDGGVRFITTNEVEKLEDLPVLLGETIHYNDFSEEAFISRVKAHITYIEEKNEERVLGLYRWWREDEENWFFAINIFGAGINGYTWTNESEISKWKPKNSFIIKEDWNEKVYYH